MNHMMLGSYTKINNGRRYGGGRGFKLNPKKFSVQRLRARFACLFRVLSRWRSSYGQAFQSLKRSMSIKRNRSRRSLMVDVSDCRITTTFGRSNSFYAEAIADCLEFIKRSSISVEQKQVCPR